MGMTVEEIKVLPRNERGVFDLKSLGGNVFVKAAEIYPVYAAFETDMNKKEGYPDIMAQMRVLNSDVKADFTLENIAPYSEMLLKTINRISPEIYENYRELVDMFRECVKNTLAKYYDADSESFNGDKADVDKFCEAVREACKSDIMLAEKYQMCF